MKTKWQVRTYMNSYFSMNWIDLVEIDHENNPTKIKNNSINPNMEYYKKK